MPLFSFLAKTKSRLAFVDTEVGREDGQVRDIGALLDDGSELHTRQPQAFFDFVRHADYLCGHNIVHHDAPHLFGAEPPRQHLIDTLYLSPLLFPRRPYHRLVKDDKLQADEPNNPLNDCQKARDLFYDELAAYRRLPEAMRQVLGLLLAGQPEFEGFFRYVGFAPGGKAFPAVAARHFEGRICAHAPLAALAAARPRELAYALALIAAGEGDSITPPWVLHTFPQVRQTAALLRHTPCAEGCPYCLRQFDLRQQLKRHFGYDQFRTFGGAPLQEQSAQAAAAGESLLAIFPTGGGKSLAFQLPALMAGESIRALTVVISPLQSLMNDQVENLEQKGITSAVTINGMLDPITRAEAIRRVREGSATLLYISPEMLRSKTIERLLCDRCVERVVVDEAHCFSAWGQDFRVDYLYIGPFIRRLQELKQLERPIPVSCFTATAKQKVIADIIDYFKHTLGLSLRLFATNAVRENLRYSVLHAEGDDEKYALLRSLLSETEAPAIVYAARTRKTEELAQRLCRDGLRALPFHGRMESADKRRNQEAFMQGRVGIIVATSAFGMGVDKQDVGMVVHYDISDSLENYVQEAGRAGRDPSMEARCYVLFCDQDLDKHFILLNQTKINFCEIQQVWRGLKEMTRQRPHTLCSALEIARQAGWDEEPREAETRVRTAVAALEQAGFVSRGNNVPHVYATGIQVKNMDEARRRIAQSPHFEEAERETAARVMKSLFTSRAVQGERDDAESRVDCLADILGLSRAAVVGAVERLRAEGLLADSRDMTALLAEGDTQHRATLLLERFARLEQFLYSQLPTGELKTTLKQLNELAAGSGLHSSVKDLHTLLNALAQKQYLAVAADRGREEVGLTLCADRPATLARSERRSALCRFLVGRLYALAAATPPEAEERDVQRVPLVSIKAAAGKGGGGGRKRVQFSVVELLGDYRREQQQSLFAGGSAGIDDIEEALLFLSKIGAVTLEGGFLVVYNSMQIDRLKETRARYRKEDYRMLEEFYRQKVQQIHIVGEYANMMVRDYAAAQRYVQDYFQMDYRQFIAKYFKGGRTAELEKNITPAKYRQLFGGLSVRQREIISDKESHCIVVAAGPGSGKTRVLVHKLASLMMLEDVKHEQLLMLTFSRAAATEFKSRLLGLIGNAAHFVEIRTFHSYCFNLLGRVGRLEGTGDVVQQAADLIASGEAEPKHTGKAVLVIDEAQDMDAQDYALVRALMSRNEEMRVIAVGDDDQNIFQFRGADSLYMRLLAQTEGGRLYEMTENFRSGPNIVALASRIAARMTRRMKQQPLAAASPLPDRVELVRHASPYMEYPIADSLQSAADLGSTCILTSTNEEALRTTVLLNHRHVPCRLIQSMEGFRFANLAEVQYLFRCIERECDSHVILPEVWEAAKEQTCAAYAASACLDTVREFFAQFEKTNRTLYLSDLREFARESAAEDFLPQGRSEVLVSTIHKAKGREFDTVYLYLSGSRTPDEEYLRQLYVGVTRARRRLFVHFDGSLFTAADAAEGCFRHDPAPYPAPAEITLQMGYRDVNLGYFREWKRQVLRLRSGMSLGYADSYLRNAEGEQVARLSARAIQEVETWQRRGYVVRSASVRYVVAWYPPEDPPNAPAVAVLLPDLHLVRQD